ncbi:MAG: hypothetical protein HZC17_05795 [Candidatus Omnitrophica bacterium]|nr:hypothetical protein [Candidatus Omnitrophota bacterium]
MKNKILYFFALIAGMLFCLSDAKWASAETIEEVLKANDIEDAQYVGTETCEMCHSDVVKNFKLTSHRRVTIAGKNTKIEGCETCHGPGSLHADAGGGVGVKIINPKKDSSICFTCHTEKRTEFQYPFHHPVLEGEMSCMDCHDIHGEKGKERMSPSPESINEVCFKCHKDKNGPFTFEHEAMRQGCNSCHQVHGSVNDKMLTVRDNMLCLRCHTQTNFPTIGGFNHGGFTQTNCSASGCHPTNISTVHHGKGISCDNCHSVHGSSFGGGGALFGGGLTSGTTTPCLSCHTNLSGQAHNFLSSGTCFSSGCHTAVHGSNFDKHLRS